MTSSGSDLILERLQALHPEEHRPLARPDRAPARRPGQSRAPPAAGGPHRRHQRQGQHARHAGGDAAGRRAAGSTATSPRIWSASTSASCIDGEPIAEDALAALLERCERANDGAPITFFEITTAAAFLAFAERPADWLLLETGLGGRLDATNVVARPRLCLITTVSMDHESYLGDHAGQAIAGEKAGILKPGVPAMHRPAGSAERWP